MEDESLYRQALDYLYSFVDYSLTKADRLAQARFDLTRMAELLRRLGDPHLAYPLIHVAGTKGKGSVTAMCSSILYAAGYRTGMYTSPHLDDYAERIQVNGTPIPHAHLVELVERIKPHIEAVPRLTTFEITTALAFLYFKEMGVEAAVIEVGLGGRLDATNVVVPVVSVITSISFDHMMVLGNTLREIATEKCGIIKPGVPVVSAPQDPEAMEVIHRIAQQRNAPLAVVGQDIAAYSIHAELTHQLIEFHIPSQDALKADGHSAKKLQVELPLLGEHQVENAAVAYLAIDRFRQEALPVSDQQIIEGYSKTHWPGRFEILQRDPPVVLDCAHNRESCERLMSTIHKVFPNRKVLLVFGASEDKDIEGMFEELLPHVEQAIFTRSFHPRAISPLLLIDKAHGAGVSAQVVDDVTEALGLALDKVSQNQAILVTGSIFVVAEARQAWRSERLKQVLSSKNLR
ncbi:MAG: folylpolyglutamate synthase/dihydrofolate synthase family protein [Anaerolineales bacterium]|nr:bifunctional folylpolyglutamate synthase/dihydrofolate synthase [Anaerolineales bacterium]MCS7247986.1 bifunctional folylpolyglutamate synthase/dihydrofolate synthase [Anaerolineales bacterium]MDW8161798.1 folylpolyglutamate synthase/dihydrofolate synthase family protein [Anaerolineales bacterium]MDW8447552.1 folylpolyglutamate synthase/dihydrofolate synthase family protein [Anaerolineales bacterium]